MKRPDFLPFPSTRSADARGVRMDGRPYGRPPGPDSRLDGSADQAAREIADEVSSLLRIILDYTQLLSEDSTFPPTHRAELAEIERAARRAADVLYERRAPQE